MRSKQSHKSQKGGMQSIQRRRGKCMQDVTRTGCATPECHPGPSAAERCREVPSMGETNNVGVRKKERKKERKKDR